MTRFISLDVSQKLTSICVVDETGRRPWRGQCGSDPARLERAVREHAGKDALVGFETGPMTSWLVHELRGRRINITCLDARHASAALKMQMNKTSVIDEASRECLALPVGRGHQGQLADFAMRLDFLVLDELGHPPFAQQVA